MVRKRYTRGLGCVQQEFVIIGQNIVIAVRNQYKFSIVKGIRRRQA